ncbi:MAG: dihydrolipoyllysine-residue acetyltransferase [Pseudomonadota bacterium]
MSQHIEVHVPDIGDVDEVDVIDVLVAVGDTVEIEQSLVTLESDKASMDVPSTHAGTVEAIAVQTGDKVAEGALIVTLSTGAQDAAPAAEPAPQAEAESAPPAASEATAQAAPAAASEDVPVTVPDIGTDSVAVIEIMVKPGDTVEAEQSLLTLESDKASMELPSPAAGEIVSVDVEVGSTVSEGDQVAVLRSDSVAPSKPAEPPEPAAAPAPAPAPAKAPEAASAPAAAQPAPTSARSPTAAMASRSGKRAHASPSVRKFARELGADVNQISGSGPKGRILKQDVKDFVRGVVENAGSVGVNASGKASQGGAGIPPIPEVDFSRFGPIERVPLSRINKLSAANLHRSWLNVPLVTHNDEADITELEAFRKSIKDEATERGVRVSGLSFQMIALARALKVFPKFNASISPDGEALIYKQYCHIGIAVDTPNGLVVPVFRDVDKKSVFDLAEEMMDVSKRAREKKLKPDEMQGASMTISSLGGIGGTHFTPLVNAPEVAILGLSRAKMQPVWNGKDFEPRLMLPLSLSYDHRAIDGADAARFCAYLATLLSDIRRLML